MARNLRRTTEVVRGNLREKQLTSRRDTPHDGPHKGHPIVSYFTTASGSKRTILVWLEYSYEASLLAL
jgi:hypothetical protein